MNFRSTLTAGTYALAVLLTGTACAAVGPSAAPRPKTATATVSTTPQAHPGAPSANTSVALPSPDPSDYVLLIRMMTRIPHDDLAQLSTAVTSDAQLLQVGRHVCAELRSQVPPAKVEKELEGAWTRPSAQMLLVSAAGQFSSLCPDQYRSVEAYVQTWA
ncbi:DUF732 domain-containing protein [Streptacidiphilus jiangxiensis]|uniref:DUF732 domain-containing protein n=1 Tax=Streptacidiphilus jiangxiensis TaxID=235985 RepID=A0A1H7QK73_STRJI|nr:DUF732 domain-containing protein [Streptacidiphilus jiangxiensis]SEL47995.1 hypothetical protein SAMN05414137_10953 [Streptacidiphilus jiangxiensis]